ncbi:MAG: hypothetical protein ACP5EQ_04590 [Candidatus Cloacimonadia bacterium]
MKVLCYIRPWGEKYYQYLCDNEPSFSEVKYISDFRRVDKVGLVKKFYQHLSSESNNQLSTINDLDREDIFLRCRLLRSLPENAAQTMFRAMEDSINSILDEVQPDIILGITVDSYVLDTLRICGQKRNIPYIGMVPVFINGYFRITARGELNKIRKPDDNECDVVLSMLLEQVYQPVYMSKHNNIYKKLLQVYAKELMKSVYFPIKSVLTNDRSNYHYLISGRLAKEHIGISQLYPQLFFDQDWEKKVASWDGPIVYLPLQFYPEATIDYWVKQIEFIDYHASVLETVKSLSRSALILVKEHPAMIGFRDTAFYRRLRKCINTVLVPSTVTSNWLIESCDVVVIWTGTAGFEAALRGKPVITFGNPYFCSGQMFTHIDSIEQLKNLSIESIIQNIHSPSRNDLIEMVRHVLSGCLPGIFKHVGFSASEPKQQRNAHDVCLSLEKYVIAGLS